ncbi:MAG: hypothetical protein HOE53_01505 [Candidatus Magasanikbacteria bacterium]|jgi:hypothetical protein|nr:hypothetical protein [Candidatus Magasanikbacteria bacterium]
MVAKSASRISAASLFAANLFPIIGVIFWEWQINHIVALFLIETMIVGLLTIPKIYTVGRKGPLAQKLQNPTAAALITLGVLLFFCIHFGGFLFTLSLGILFFVLDGFGTLLTLGWMAPLTVLVSHVVSLAVNFYGKQEYLKKNLLQVSLYPYKRLIILWFLMFIGIIVLDSVEGTIQVLLIFVVVKSLLDYLGYKMEHATKNAKSWYEQYIAPQVNKQYPEGLVKASQEHLRSQMKLGWRKTSNTSKKNKK